VKKIATLVSNIKNEESTNPKISELNKKSLELGEQILALIMDATSKTATKAASDNESDSSHASASSAEEPDEALAAFTKSSRMHLFKSTTILNEATAASKALESTKQSRAYAKLNLQQERAKDTSKLMEDLLSDPSLTKKR
jgi:hypothetical protein